MLQQAHNHHHWTIFHPKGLQTIQPLHIIYQLFSFLPSSYLGAPYAVRSAPEIGEISRPKHNQSQTVTQLVPYRVKKIENAKEQSSLLSRDERAAKNLHIPYSVQFIINCSMEEFTDLLNNKSLDNKQIGLCRDIRKRGKNKVNSDQTI